MAPQGRRARLAAAALAVACVLEAGRVRAAAADALPALASVNGSDLTVSGLSSGAFMAVQLHVVQSSKFRGAGILAGGPFYCAQGLEMNALLACMSQPNLISLNQLVAYTASQESKSAIDSTSNLQTARVWIFSGSSDTVVNPGVVRKLEQFYEQYTPTPGLIKTEYGVPAEHSFPTTSYGNACNFKGQPYINNCNFDAAGAMLQHLYADSLRQPEASGAASGTLLAFDQRPFFPSSPDPLMQDTGYIYVPAQCAAGSTSASGSCGLHVALHGCLQTTDKIGTEYVEHTGLLPWADANGIVLLFPQAKSAMLKNPNGCWDWWGFTGANYASRQGAQQLAIMGMVDHILAKGAASSTKQGVAAVVI